MLAPGVTRAEGAASASLKARKTGTVRLLMPASEDLTPYRSFVMIVETVSGETIWNGPATKSGNAVGARVPAHRLPPGDYLVSLKGISANAIDDVINEASFSIR